VRAPDRVGARQALAGTGVRIGSIPHPSPASPAANRGWEQLAAAAFLQLGVAI
jgi:single-strand selective monofunctional uracil DNA glycosylase